MRSLFALARATRADVDPAGNPVFRDAEHRGVTDLQTSER
jgi:hypothetical protein